MKTNKFLATIVPLLLLAGFNHADARPCSYNQDCFEEYITTSGGCYPGPWIEKQRGVERPIGAHASQVIINDTHVDLFLKTLSERMQINASSIEAKRLFADNKNNTFTASLGSRCPSGGSSYTELRYYPKNNNNYRLICSQHQGLSKGFDCRNIALSLEQIDPDLNRQVEELKREIASLQGEERTLISENTEFSEKFQAVKERTEILNEELKAVTGLDFDLISTNSLVELIKEDASVKTVYDDLKKTVDQLKSEIESEIKDNGARIEADYHVVVAGLASKQLNSASFQFDDTFSLNDTAVGNANGINLNVSPGNPVASIANEFIERFEQSINDGHAGNFAAQYQAWMKAFDAIHSNLQANGALLGEMNAFNQAREKVRQYVGQRVDAYGFFKDVKVSDRYRRTIADDLKKFDAGLSDQFRDEMNSWQSDLNENQLKTLDILAEYSDLLLDLNGSDPAEDKQKNAIKIAKATTAVGLESLLSAVKVADGSGSQENFEERLEEANTSLQVAKAVADLALRMTPGVSLGIDSYEAITGRNYLTGEDLSVSERTFAILGVGTGGGVSLLKGALKAIPKISQTIYNRLGSAFVRVGAVRDSAQSASKVLDSAGKVLNKNPTSQELGWYANLTKKAGSIERAEVLSQEISALSKELKFTDTAAKRMEAIGRFVPQGILAEAIRTGRGVTDPQGAVGAMKYTIDMFKNGKKYELEVVYREADKTILHFLYK